MPKGQTVCPYIFRRGALFYFRFVFPDRLANIIGQRELRLALRTGYRATAIRRAIRLSARLQDIAASTCPENNMDATQLETIVRNHIANAFEERETWRCTQHHLPESEIANELIALEYLERDNRDQLRQHDYSRIRATARHLLQEAGLTIPDDQPAFWRFCRSLLKADGQILQTEIRRTYGEYDHEQIVIPAAPLTPSAPPATSASRLKLSEVIAQFTADHLQANRWQDKTRTDNAAMFRDFMEIIGEPAENVAIVPVADILANDAQLQVGRYVLPDTTKQLQARLAKAETIALGDLVTTIRPLPPAPDDADGVDACEIGAADLPDRGYIGTPGRTIKVSGKSEQQFLRPLDIVLIVKGSTGKLGIVSPEAPQPGNGGWVAGQSAIVLRGQPGARIDPLTLALQLRSPLGQQLLSGIVSGATIPLIQLKELTRLQVLVPDQKTIQRAAAAFATEVQLQQKINRLRAQQAEATAHLWPLD
jgi:hypothetical protein